MEKILRWIPVAVFLFSSFFFVGTGVAQAGGVCDLFPGSAGCEGGGSGGGGTGATTTTLARSYYWGAWFNSGECSDGDPRYLRYLLWSNGGGYVLPPELPNPPVGSILGTDRVYQVTCPDVRDFDVWEVLETEIEALPPLLWEASPAGQGVTGLESWMWFSGETQVGPVTLSWTDPVTRITFNLEGRAWIGDIKWSTGDGDNPTTYALTYQSGAAIGGSEAHPAVTHLYEVSSADSGFEDGYPVALEVTWTGEWRWREAGGGWTPYRPMLNTASFSTNGTYEVVQIVSVLQP